MNHAPAACRTPDEERLLFLFHYHLSTVDNIHTGGNLSAHAVVEAVGHALSLEVVHRTVCRTVCRVVCRAVDARGLAVEDDGERLGTLMAVVADVGAVGRHRDGGVGRYLVEQAVGLQDVGVIGSEPPVHHVMHRTLEVVVAGR